MNAAPLYPGVFCRPWLVQNAQNGEAVFPTQSIDVFSGIVHISEQHLISFHFEIAVFMRTDKVLMHSSFVTVDSTCKVNILYYLESKKPQGSRAVRNYTKFELLIKLRRECENLRI